MNERPSDKFLELLKVEFPNKPPGDSRCSFWFNNNPLAIGGAVWKEIEDFVDKYYTLKVDV